MKKIAVTMTKGGWNNPFQACEWIAMAAGIGMEVSGYFRDEAAGRMTKDKIKELTMSPDYRGREGFIRDILKNENKADLPTMMETSEEKGNVKFSVCTDSLKYFGVTVEEINLKLDEVQPAEAFWKEAILPADQVLTF